MLAFSFDSVPLHDVIVVVSAFETCLHFSELVLNPVKLDTSLFAGLTHFAHFFFLLS